MEVWNQIEGMVKILTVSDVGTRRRSSLPTAQYLDTIRENEEHAA